MEPTFFVIGLCGDFGLAVVLLGDGVSTQQNLVLLAEFDLYSFEHPTYIADGNR